MSGFDAMVLGLAVVIGIALAYGLMTWLIAKYL